MVLILCKFEEADSLEFYVLGFILEEVFVNEAVFVLYFRVGV